MTMVWSLQEVLTAKKRHQTLLVLPVLLSLVQAQVLFGGECPPLKPMAYFEPNQFLGRWFEIARFYVSFEGLAGTCWVENYHYDRNRGHFTVLEWKDHITRRIRTVENGILHDKKEQGLLKYSLQRPNLPFIRGKYLILATDYERYALAWQCDNLPLGVAHTEILWFLSRDQFPDPSVTKKVIELTKKFGLNPSHFEFQNRKGCPH
ncbi:Lipocalin/cytosolic fatty-acid binding domain [Trinorchestia longiramus]|nr:Lipocalin/cytosolic fatty-acid binding domain [Trinorchestia longiramus]